MKASKRSIFQIWEPKFHSEGFIAVAADGKRPVQKNWEKAAALNETQRAAARERFADFNIGVLAGSALTNGARLSFVDIDHPGFVAFAERVLHPITAGKIGAKGATYFCQTKLAKSRKLTVKGRTAPVIEIFVNSGLTICPPSIHPSGIEYYWSPRSLLDVDHNELPILDEVKLRIMEHVVRNKHAWTIVDGGPNGKFHSAMLSLASSGVANLSDDLEWLAECLNALLPDGYTGNTREETLEMLQSAKRKGLGRRHFKEYDHGEIGPIALGYAGSEFIFRNQQTKEVVRKSSVALSTPAALFELAPKSFWEERYAKISKEGTIYGIDFLEACSALIEACRRAGSMDISRIRGIGVWPEDNELVINLGGEQLESSSYIYTAPKQLVLGVGPVPIESILEFLRKPDWITGSAAELLLGWSFASVICGALHWRPHAGLTGPAAAGKSTVMRGIAHILAPLAIQREGISTEAGIRQTIGYDARPVLLDELEPESSRDRARVERIVKFMRSSSSADAAVARGTPEGKALNFNARAMFLIGAINIYRISAADTSRLVKFEMQRIDPEAGRATGIEVRELLKKLTPIGPAFCQLSIDNGVPTLASIPLIHRAIPVVQERQADNMATLIAGYWSALNRRTISASEVDRFVDPFVVAVQEQRESLELDDAIECLNALLGFSAVVERFESRDDGGTMVLRETMSLGTVISNVLDSETDRGEWVATLNQFGIKAADDGFLVANSHPALQRVYRGTRWEGGLWGSALARVEGAQREKQRRFSDGVRSLAVWIPRTQLPPVPGQGD